LLRFQARNYLTITRNKRNTGCNYTNGRHGRAWNISVRRKSTNKLLNAVDPVVYFGKTNDKSSSVGKIYQ
jgi:hypothetical protein